VNEDPARWRRVKDLCDAALERDAPHRDAFLRTACGDDDELRREVESLLIRADRVDEFLGASTLQAVAHAMVLESRGSLIGDQVGAYEVTEYIGSGGMGEVYRARDTKLHRDVALKVLPEIFLKDPERLARFQREAIVLASLNHPHIGAIYGFEESNDISALVLELVEGPTLADRIAQGPIPADEACSIANQIATALEEAHQRGIVHRDLKPANVKIRPDGTVKVLDFGLAKAAEPDGRTQSRTPTPPVAPTGHGVILGTTSYMAPEQARGRVVDKRADIWAFGCVLWEMLTGQAAFAAETASDTISAILMAEPAWTHLPTGTPAGIRRLLRRCLEKDLTRRLHDIADARLEIDETRAGIADAGGTAVTAAAITRDVEFRRLTDFVGMKQSPAVSPDGKMVAFVTLIDGRRQIWIRLLAGGVPLQVTRNDGDHCEPRWTPDGSTLLYYSPSVSPTEHGALWEIAALGGPPRHVASGLGGGDVSHDGRRIALFQVSAEHIELVTMTRDGSQRTCVARVSPEYTYRTPRWSPDDRLLAFQRDSLAFTNSLQIVPAVGGEPREVARSAWLDGFAWLPDGSGLVYSSSRGSTILYPPIFNLRTVGLHGPDDRQLTYGDQSFVEPDVHQSGCLLASRIRSQSDIWKFSVGGSPTENTQARTRVTRQTGQAQTPSVSPSVSPNGVEIAYLSDNGGHGNLWIATMDGTSVRQITFERDPAVSVGVPVWSPVGDWIVFVVAHESRSALWLIRPDGSGLHELVHRGWGPCWERDGRNLIYTTGQDGPARLERIAVDGGTPVVVRTNASTPAVAADGRTLYYVHGLKPELLGLLGDLEICCATVGEGPSHTIGRIAASRVPVSVRLLQLFLSPDGQWLATPLVDGATSNVWALPTSGGPMKRLTDFGDRPNVIARSVSWSADGQSLFAAVAETETDVVLFDGLIR
jgi:Tol biopolymer transport system component/tRNA A-37 threonylcarbamoyl transferase component Bud32